MKKVSSPRRLSSLLLVTLSLITPSIAQQKQEAATPTPSTSVVQTKTPGTDSGVTFDSLLAARSYKVYGEVRMIGQLVRSNAVKEFLDTARLLGRLPKEMTSTIEFASANAEALAASRLMFATEPARAGLPQNFLAIEMASPEDAIKLEPKFRSFVSSLRTQTAPPPTQGVASLKKQTSKSGPSPKQQAGQTPPSTSPANNTVKPVLVQRAGSILLMSETPLTLKNLRPDGSQSLSFDQNFQRARSRFATEPLFLYFDIKLTSTAKKVDVTLSTPQSGKPPAQTESAARLEQTAPEEEPPPPVASPTPSSETIYDEDDSEDIAPEVQGAPVGPQTGTGAPPAPKRDLGDLIMSFPIYMAMFGGEPVLPEAIGLAAALEGDDVVVRAMIINPPGTPNAVIPFLPTFVAGPEIAPRASALAPADTALFVSVSLDPPRIYDAMLKGIKESLSRRGGPQQAEASPVELEMAMFEQALGFKIKEDLLGSLGNEVAVALPASLFRYSPNTGIPIPSEAGSAAPASQTGVTVFVSLNDKERVRTMLPRLLEVIGLKAPGAPAQTEKRADIEITNYGTLWMAFIDDFLVISQEAAALRSVVDAHESSQTLAGSTDFRNSTNWQSSRLLGQVYLSPEMISNNQQPFVQLDDQLQDFFSRYNQRFGPITHEVVSDNAGPFHELHLPADWVTMFLASMTADRKASPIMSHELQAVAILVRIRSAETAYKEGKGKGSFATRDQLVREHILPKTLLEMEGYRIEITTTGDKFQVTAAPTEYGKTGRQSFYLDESGIIRGADHGGQPGTVADKPL